jgi:hypothetical protein
MNDLSPMGHNFPPTPMEECATVHDATISEAQNWGDGCLTETQGQHDAVDVLIKGMKSYRSALTKAGKEHTDPAHKAWKSKVAEVKVYSDDGDILQAALVSANAPFKLKLEAEREAERKAAWDKAREAEREANEREATANAASIEEVRAVAAAREAALDAKKAASAAQKNTTQGLRKVTNHEVMTLRGLVNWCATNKKAEMEVFAREIARKFHAEIPDEIVRTWTEKEAF